jgi:4-hydroxybenzoate polyprenyltransferase
MPATIRQRLIDLLAIGRVANLPTVWSNVIVGFLLAWSTADVFFLAQVNTDEVVFRSNLVALALLLLGTSCAYLFGTYLNDWKDAEFDREHRPERAIPSGRWSRRAILCLALSFAVVAATCFIYLGFNQLPMVVWGAALLACIVIYTFTHKKTPRAIIPMGLCRSILYALGFFVVYVPTLQNHTFATGPTVSPFDDLRSHSLLILILMAMGILCYVGGLSLAARYESRPENLRIPRAFLWFLIFFPFLTHSWWWIWERPPFLEGWELAIPVLCGLLPFLFWTTRALFVLRNNIPDFVSRALAGLCLVDLLAFPGIAATIRTGWFPLDAYPILLAFIPLALFLVALLLQRIAPAT